MSRRGMVAKRCRACGRRVTDRRCTICGSDAVAWSYTIDTGPVGGTRHQQSKSGFKTKNEAVAALTRIQAAISEGTYVAPSRQTLADFLTEEWLPSLKTTIRPTTLLSYEMHVRNHITPHLGHVRLQQVAPADFNALYAKLLSEGRADGAGGLAPSSVRRVHATVHRALRDAVRWGQLARNPADYADPPKLGASMAREMSVWAASQVREFLEHVREDRLGPLFLLASTTGLRRGELLGLQWADLDLQARRLSVRRSRVAIGYAVSVSEPKTRRGIRQIAVDDVTFKVLREYRKRQLKERFAWGPAWHDSGFVFTKEDGKPLHPDHVSKRFDRLVRSSGLPRIRFHDLRHTYATLALQAGVHPKVVSERLGHASISITLDTYSHAIPALDEDAARRVAALVFPREA